MKVSKFNYFVEAEDGDVLAFNFMTQALLKIESDVYQKYLRAVSGDEIVKVDGSDPALPAFFKDFKKGGFLIDDNVNEINQMKLRHMRGKFSPNGSAGMTIGVTTACNFKCEYCYENIEPQFMSREVEDAIIDFISKMRNKSSLGITWYGGEPLLAADTIYRLSDAILKIVEKKDLNYYSNIVTNGYLYDRTIATELAKRKVSSVQITVDGIQEEHDKRRILKNGGGTFHTIINNIKQTFDIIPINLRVNLAKSNIDSFPKLLDYLDEHGITSRLASISPAMMEAYDFSPDRIKEDVFSPQEYVQFYYKMANMLLDRGVKTGLISSLTNVFCIAVSQYSYVIGPDGSLYKCWDTIGNANEKVGTIQKGVRHDETELKWLLWDKLDDEKCQGCKLLPRCLGGCPRLEVIRDEVCNKRDHCPTTKYDIPGFIRLLYRQGRIMQENKKREA